MMFRNMEALGVTDARRVAKVGDTVSDIREGKNAGCISIGVIEGYPFISSLRRDAHPLTAKPNPRKNAPLQCSNRIKEAVTKTSIVHHGLPDEHYCSWATIHHSITLRHGLPSEWAPCSYRLSERPQ